MFNVKLLITKNILVDFCRRLDSLRLRNWVIRTNIQCSLRTAPTHCAPQSAPPCKVAALLGYRLGPCPEVTPELELLRGPGQRQAKISVHFLLLYLPHCFFTFRPCLNVTLVQEVRGEVIWWEEIFLPKEL